MVNEMQFLNSLANSKRYSLDTNSHNQTRNRRKQWETMNKNCLKTPYKDETMEHKIEEREAQRLFLKGLRKEPESFMHAIQERTPT
jgi:hypothetical protein